MGPGEVTAWCNCYHSAMLNYTWCCQFTPQSMRRHASVRRLVLVVLVLWERHMRASTC